MRTITVFCLFFAGVLLLSCGKKRESIRPIRSDISESVYAFGVVKAEGQYQVFSTVTGILKGIKVQPGDRVRVGDPLFVIENTTSNLNEENARLALQLSAENSRKGSEKIQELELAVGLARQRYLLDSSLYVRQVRLFDAKVGSRLDLEQKELSYTNSKTSYEVASSRLQQRRTQLTNEWQRAQVNYRLSKKVATDYSIRSNLTGVVYDVFKTEVGELVSPQMPLAVLGHADRFLLELEVDENDIVRVRKGQWLVVTMDSYGGQLFEACVDRIDPIMNERSRTFTVGAHFIKPPKKVYPNLTVEANMLVRIKKNAITIPKNYLVEGTYVWVSDSEKRAVKIGLSDYQKVEVLQGLNETDLIYKPK